MSKRRRQFVVSLPAFLGSSLVLVYVFGILNAAGSFYKADIPQSAIRFLSIEQLLVRGISILAQPSVIVNILTIGIGVMVMERVAWKASGPLSPAQRKRITRRGIKLGSLYLLLVGGACLFKPWEVGLSAIPFMILAAVMVWVSKRGIVPHSISRPLNLLFATAALGSLLLASYLLPLPQPRVTAVCPSEYPRWTPCPVGVLITHTDESWYVWQQSGGVMSVVPDTALVKVDLTYPPPEKGDSPIALLKQLVF